MTRAYRHNGYFEEYSDFGFEMIETILESRRMTKEFNDYVSEYAKRQGIYFDAEQANLISDREYFRAIAEVSVAKPEKEYNLLVRIIDHVRKAFSYRLYDNASREADATGSDVNESESFNAYVDCIETYDDLEETLEYWTEP